MTLKQKLIKEYKDARYLYTLWVLRLQHLSEDDKHYKRNLDDWAAHMLAESKAIDRLKGCFSDKDKKYLLPKLDAECENVAKTHFVIYNMASESEV